MKTCSKLSNGKSNVIHPSVGVAVSMTRYTAQQVLILLGLVVTSSPSSMESRLRSWRGSGLPKDAECQRRSATDESTTELG